ncbi:MAG TPA: hemerythrin domain-containing protein [Sphingopyxis sp.]|uniref:hemerythrin domain-containing protein n=1 Tax=Sphingopyxis sp. TaxID=1908224 RepID=UPI002BCB8FD4|nr:hemerythrin domain-containing protein [Sphingopyxis sp.]HWW55499.1 hemerythrin domain-containing protein [Sphingopyxis sp.]
MTATKTAPAKGASNGAKKQAPTAAKPAAKPASKTKGNGKPESPAARPADAIKLLKADHKEVKTWFKQYEKLEANAEKQSLADTICLALTVHAQIEEEIFYPAARLAIDDEDLFDEAEVEHGSAKQLIAEIQAMKAGDRLFDAKVIVLGEYIDHHVQEEEEEMFPEARDSDLDLKALGLQLAARKEELMAEAGQ